MEEKTPPKSPVAITVEVPMAPGSIVVAAAVFWRQPDGMLAGAIDPMKVDGTPYVTDEQTTKMLRGMADTIELEGLLG